jgi:DNA-binding transcriptional LysR family regulator
MKPRRSAGPAASPAPPARAPDDLAGLPALLAVADKRSFTAAAAHLRVTPSAVSQTIRALEQRVGVRLLQRTTRSVGLTEAGAGFVARLRPALGEVQSAFDSLGDLRDRPAGLLRLNLPRVGHSQVVEPILAAFLAQYPDIRIELCIDDGLADIVAGGFDAGIRLGEIVEREMIAVRVSGEESSAVVGSPAYFAIRGKPRHPRDLQAHDCINYRHITSGGIYRWEFTENGKDFEVAVDGRVVANDIAVLIQGAVDGLGLAYVLESTARELIAAQKLVRVLASFCPPFPGFFLYYPSRTYVTPKLRALLDFLQQRRGRATRPRR